MAEAEAELEVHAGHEHGHAHEHDGTRFGKAIALKVSLIGVVLAVVTIGSHRAHNAAVMSRSKANDHWSEYQSQRIRGYIAETVVKVLPQAGGDPAKARELVAAYEADATKYGKKTADSMDQATADEKATETEESRAAYLDTSEGFFELGLVMSSLYFLSRRKLFPIIGIVSAVIGAVFGVLGFLLS